MLTLNKYKRLLSAMPFFNNDMTGGALSLCSSIILHMSVVGGIITLSHYTHDAGGNSKSIQQTPVFITIVQENSTNLKTPEKVQQKFIKKEKRTKSVDKITTPTFSGNIPIPQKEKNKKESKSESISAPSSLTTQSGKSKSSYTGGSGKAEIRYQDKVRAKIEVNRIYPRSARRRKMEGEAIVQIHINRNGQITKTQFLKTTGHHILDQAVLDMVKASNPLPIIPPSIKKKSVSINVPIGFQLK